MDYCQHYNVEGTKITCNAGVDRHARFSGKEGGIFKYSPCIKGHEKADDPTTMCEHWLRKTREMGEDRADGWDKIIRDLELVTPVISEWRKKEPIGKAEVIECPVCKGKLHLSQAACNGHVHGKCETDNCVFFME